MKKFSDIYTTERRGALLTESKKVSKLKLIYISTITNSTFSKMLREKSRERDIVFHQVNPETARLVKVDDKNYEVVDGDRSFTCCVDDTIVLPRLTILKNSRTKNFLKDFEYRGFFVLNNLESYENCENKYTTYKVLSTNGIPTPDTTVICADDMCRLDKKIAAVGGKFPIVCKLLDGKKGVGVFIIDSYMSIKSTFETLFKLVPNAEILMQNKIESDYDLRIHVFNKSYNRLGNNPDDYEIIGVMRRNKVQDDFRTNFSLGGTIEKFELTDEQKALAIKTAACVKCKWCGVDMITDKNTGDNYIIEVNASPGVKGITSVSDVPPINYIFDYFANYRYVTSSNAVIGNEESAAIAFGDVSVETPVKFDVNSAFNIIRIPENEIFYDEKANEVKFCICDKNVSCLVMGSMLDKDGGVSYLVSGDMEFNDTKYNHVVFEIVKSDEKGVYMGSPFLSCLGNMVSIDPNNKYILTDIISE